MSEGKFNFSEYLQREDVDSKDFKFWNSFFLSMLADTEWVSQGADKNAYFLARMFTALPFKFARKKRTKKVANVGVDNSGSNPLDDDPVPDFEDANVVEIRRYWQGRYTERFNSPYVFNYGRDTKLLKVMMESVGDLRHFIDMFLDDTDDFVLRAGKSIPVFYSRFNIYVQRGVQNDESSIINRY